MTTRLVYLVSHPIQYQAPLLRLIAAMDGIKLRVVFERDTEDGYFDSGFGRFVRWDVPLRQGYDSIILDRTTLQSEIASADVVWLHGWQGPVKKKALRLARRLGKPVLMRGENTDVAMPDGPGLRGVAKRLYLRWVFAHVTAFLAIGTDNAQYYRHRGVEDRRIFSMPYAVDNDAFAKGAGDVAVLRRELGIDADRDVVLFAGKLMPRKHPHTLLSAWRQTDWQGRPPLLVFAGTGEMQDRLRAEAGGDPDVRFLGFQNQGNLPMLYGLADVFVLASECEPWGLAVNEAMACGTAVVVGDGVGCAADLVTAETGILVPPGDATALGQALQDLLPRARAAGLAAKQRIDGWDFKADLAGLAAALRWVRQCV